MNVEAKGVIIRNHLQQSIHGNIQEMSQTIEYDIKKDTLRPPEDVFGPISTPT